MVKITLSGAAGRYALRCTGHAEGRPEVCAAVSALVQTMARWLHCTGAVIETERLEPGDAEMRFAGLVSRDGWDFLRLGLLGVAEAAPEAVRVEEAGAVDLGLFGEAGGPSPARRT